MSKIKNSSMSSNKRISYSVHDIIPIIGKHVIVPKYVKF